MKSNISDHEIERRIHQFRKLVEDGLDEQVFFNHLSTIFGENFAFNIYTSGYQKGTRFYRARAIPDSDHIIPLQTIRSVSDAWEAPSHVIKIQNRLNAVGERVLYCYAGDLSLALEESGAFQGRRAAVMVYDAVRDIKVTNVGTPPSMVASLSLREKRFF